MSIKQQNINDPDTSAQVYRGHRLTASNLALHKRNTTTISTDHVIHSWSDDSGTSPPVHVDDQTWTRLVEEDLVAAAIEAATGGVDGGDRGREEKK